MNKFETLQDLRLEKQRLHLKKEVLSNQIKDDFEDFKESLKPMNLVKELFHKNGSSSNTEEKGLSPNALSIGSTILDLVLSKTLFGNSSLIKKIVSSYVIKATGPSLLNKVVPLVSGYVKDIISDLSKKKNHKSNYEQSTASDLY